MGHLQEIDALQRWVLQDARLSSMKLGGAPPTVARPVILWEHPRRGPKQNIDRYNYNVEVQQYGKLFVERFDQAGVIVEQLYAGLEERYGILKVYEAVGSAREIAILKNVSVEFSTSETMDIPFMVTYQATYGRRKPDLPPPAREVYHKLTASTDDRGRLKNGGEQVHSCRACNSSSRGV